MKEQLISFETAQLAKERGFDIPTLDGFDSKTQYEFFDKQTLTDWNNRKSKIIGRSFISRPTQSLLQTWLLEQKGINIELTFDDGQWFIYVGEFSYPDRFLGLVALIECDSFKDAIIKKPLALEKGLQEALKLIKI